MTETPRAPANELRTTVKVYLEDTDAQGVVYHANYLKYFERARSDYLEEHGVGIRGAQEKGYRFMVYSMEIKFHRPAQLGDRLDITTQVSKSSPFRVLFDQRATRGAEAAPLTAAKVHVVCVDADGQLCEIPDDILPVE